MSSALMARLDMIGMQAHAVRAGAEVLIGLVEEARMLLASQDQKDTSEAEDLQKKIRENDPSRKERPVFGGKTYAPAPHDHADPEVGHPQGGV